MIIANCSLRFSDNYFSSGRVVGKPETEIGPVANFRVAVLDPQIAS
jgi:hypothetical protein